MGENPTIDEIMSSEIKRDIAQRYFGFRKLIEDDELALQDKIKHYSYILEKRISFDLIRIYVLLKDKEIIRDFLELIGLHSQLFYDPYLAESATISRRVLSCQRFRGLFRFSRFRNYILDTYQNLVFHSDLYRQKIDELEDDQKMITEEIKQFYHDNDLSVIMHFLKAMGDPQLTGPMRGGLEIGLAEGLDKKLNIAPPQPIEQTLTILPSLKPLPDIKSALKKLVKRAYKIQSPELLTMFDYKNTPCNQRTDDPV